MAGLADVAGVPSFACDKEEYGQRQPGGRKVPGDPAERRGRGRAGQGVGPGLPSSWARAEAPAACSMGAERGEHSSVLVAWVPSREGGLGRRQQEAERRQVPPGGGRTD